MILLPKEEQFIKLQRLSLNETNDCLSKTFRNIIQLLNHLFNSFLQDKCGYFQ